MMTGMPVVALATTEYTTVIINNISGIIHTDVDYLIEKMKELISNKSLAASLGEEGKKVAEKRFNIERFTKEWEQTFQTAIRSKAIKYDKENSIY